MGLSLDESAVMTDTVQVPLFTWRHKARCDVTQGFASVNILYGMSTGENISEAEKELLQN